MLNIEIVSYEWDILIPEDIEMFEENAIRTVYMYTCACLVSRLIIHLPLDIIHAPWKNSLQDKNRHRYDRLEKVSMVLFRTISYSFCVIICVFTGCLERTYMLICVYYY
jgi:hypothetical protein